MTNKKEVSVRISATLKGRDTHKEAKLGVIFNAEYEYEKKPKICPICGKGIPFSRRKRKTCCDECAGKLRS